MPKPAPDSFDTKTRRTEAETAVALYERIRQDSLYRMAPYRVVVFVAEMMKRDPFAVLNAIGVTRVADDTRGSE